MPRINSSLNSTASTRSGRLDQFSKPAHQRRCLRGQYDADSLRSLQKLVQSLLRLRQIQRLLQRQYYARLPRP